MIQLNGKRISALLSLSLLASLCACGDDKVSSLNYTGAATPATLTATNSAALVSGAYSGGNSGLIIGKVSAGLTNYNYGASHRPRALVLAEALLKFAHLAAVDDTLARPDTAATAGNIPGSTLHGNCGGSAAVNGSYDDDNRTFSLSANLDNYCRDGTTLNGTVGASGVAASGKRQRITISSITATFTMLTARYRGDDFSADGTMSISPQTGHAYVEGNMIITLGMLIKDKATAKTYKLEDFRITRTSTVAAVSFEDITISGRYYDPDEGYIDLITPTPLRLINGDQWPSSGSLRATGKSDSATLTAQSNTTYQLDIDKNGNGSVDSTESGLWTNV